MSSSLSTVRQLLRHLSGAWLLGGAVLLAGLAVTYQFVGPPPPQHIVMATGDESGAYHLFGRRLAEILARDGLEVELRATAGSVENLRLLTQADAVDLAFVQSGLAASVDPERVVAIGTMYLEPLWLFVKSGLLIDDLGDLRGTRIAVGADGSGTRAVVLELLEANGVYEGNSLFAELSAAEAVTAFESNEIDAAFVVGAPAAASVTALVELADVSLHAVPRAEAYARQYSFLSALKLPRGVLNLQADIPAEDTRTVAVGATLVAREDFHPALIDLLLVAAANVFGGHGLLADAGEFPTPLFVDLPLSEEAARHFTYGPPFLIRYLPFWAATLVDRLWILLLPLIGLSVPLLKLIPPVYHWQIRRRLLRIYASLDAVDPQQTQVRSENDALERIKKLESLENDSVVQSVPRSYTAEVYQLRRDIDLVRRRLNAAAEASGERSTDRRV